MFSSSDAYRSLSDGTLSGWPCSKNKTADEAILSGLEKLQAQSSDQIRNDALAAAAINNMVTGTVGSGLKPQPSVDYDLIGISEDEAHKFTRRAEKLFRWWANSKTCDFSSSHTFWEIESLFFRSSLEFGDAFLLKRRYNEQLALQMIEAPRIMTPLSLEGNKYIKSGLELDKNTGAINAIHVISKCENHLEDIVRVSFYDDKDKTPQIIHLAHKKRIGQTRGVPFLATVTSLLKQLSRFAEGETNAAVLNSFLAFVTKTRDGSSPLPDSGVVGSWKKRIAPIPQKISPNMNVHLRDGESIEMLDPKRPNSNFSAFFEAIVKLIGAELEIPFEVLLSSFNSSYSASRASMVKAFQVYKLKRKWLVENFHRQVWDWFIEDCIRREMLIAPGFFDDPMKRAAYTGCEWVGDSALQIDPLKEANGAAKQYELGVISKTTLTQLLTGQNYEAVLEQRKREKHLEEN